MLKTLECEVNNRLEELDTNMNQQSTQVQQLDKYIAKIDEQLDIVLSTDKESKKCLNKLEGVLSEYRKECKKELSIPYTPQEIPSSFITLIEPDLGLELIEKQGGRRSNVGGDNMSQMGEVKYKDTFSTCDNHTIANNLELTTENTMMRQDFINCTLKMHHSLQWDIE